MPESTANVPTTYRYSIAMTCFHVEYGPEADLNIGYHFGFRKPEDYFKTEENQSTKGPLTNFQESELVVF